MTNPSSSRRRIPTIGENIDIKHMTIHQVVKTANSTTSRSYNPPNVLTISSVERKFMQNVNEAHHRRSNRIYGTFNANSADRNDFNSILDDSLINERNPLTDQNDSFLTMTCSMTDLYTSIIKDIKPATGGMLIYSHFINNDNQKEYFVIIGANNESGLNIDEESLTINEVNSVDFSKLDVACQIDLTKYRANSATSPAEDYLSFINGKKEISNYFMRFLNCTEESRPKIIFEKLMNAINAFCREEGYTREQKIATRDKIIDYSTECINNNIEILLSNISPIVNPREPESFKRFANSEEYGVSEVLHLQKAHLRKYKYIVLREDNNNIELKLSRATLNDEVTWNSDTREVNIKVSQKLIDNLQSEFNNT